MGYSIRSASRLPLAPCFGAGTRLIDRHAVPLVVLWLVSATSNVLVQQLHILVPGNALAIVVILVLLSTIRSASRFFEATAALLARHLSLFFAPLAVAISDSWKALVPILIPLTLTLVISIACGILVTGIVAQSFLRGHASCR